MVLVGKVSSIEDEDENDRCVVYIRYAVVRRYRAWADSRMCSKILQADAESKFHMFAYVHDLAFEIDDTTHEITDVEVVF